MQTLKRLPFIVRLVPVFTKNHDQRIRMTGSVMVRCVEFLKKAFSSLFLLLRLKSEFVPVHLHFDTNTLIGVSYEKVCTTDGEFKIIRLWPTQTPYSSLIHQDISAPHLCRRSCRQRGGSHLYRGHCGKGVDALVVTANFNIQGQEVEQRRGGFAVIASPHYARDPVHRPYWSGCFRSVQFQISYIKAREFTMGGGYRQR